MDTDTPPGWLTRGADLSPDSPALILADGTVSYADLDHQVNLRVRTLSREDAPGDIVPVPVHLDLASVVEVLAVMRSGRVPFPYFDEYPTVAHAAPSGTAMCIGTSGSRGVPRIVPLSHGNISASVEASRLRLGNGSSDRWLATLPLHHIGGLAVIWRSLEAGGAAVLAPFDASIESVLSVTQPTFASLVPTMVHRLIDRSPEGLAGIGVVLTGGAHLRAALERRAAQVGVSLVPTYGMTETSSQIATSVPGDHNPGVGIIGPLLDGFSVSIRRGEDIAAPGEIGVIEVDGPAVFRGYLGDPERLEPHRTADRGFLDEDGHLGVVGRIDDVVVTGGENVSLSFVGSTIENIAGVVGATAVAVADAEWGAAICAVVHIDDGAREGDVLEAMSAGLPTHAMPKQIVFGDVPLLPNGKHDVPAVQRYFDTR